MIMWRAAVQEELQSAANVRESSVSLLHRIKHRNTLYSAWKIPAVRLSQFLSLLSASELFRAEVLHLTIALPVTTYF